MKINAKNKQNEKLKSLGFQQPSTATHIPPVEGREWCVISRGINTVLRQQGEGKLKVWGAGMEAEPWKDEDVVELQPCQAEEPVCTKSLVNTDLFKLVIIGWPPGA